MIMKMTRRNVLSCFWWLIIVTQQKEEKLSEGESDTPTTLYIDGFIKPFQVDEVKELVSRVVKPINTDEHFYMNGIKSFCYVTYKSLDDAKQALNDLYG